MTALITQKPTNATSFGGTGSGSQTLVVTSQVGDQMLYNDVGTAITKPNGEVWFRDGFIGAASLYPKAAAFEPLKINNLTLVPIKASVTPISKAEDGTGNVVIVYSDGSAAYSTNYGKTFTVTATAFTTASSVVWTGTVFIIGTWATTTLTLYYVTVANIATAWTAGGTATTATTPGVLDMVMCWDSVGLLGLLYACVNGATQVLFKFNQAGTSLTGMTVTGMPLNVSAVPFIVCIPSLGVNRWIVGNFNSSIGNQIFQSTAVDCSTIVSPVTNIPLLPQAPQGAIAFNNNLYIVDQNSYNTSGLVAVRKATLTAGVISAWTTITLGKAYLDTTGGNPAVPSGTISTQFNMQVDTLNNVVLFAGTYTGSKNTRVFWTPDFVQFYERQCVNNTGTAFASAFVFTVPMSNGSLLQWGSTANSNLYSASNGANWKLTCDYVGRTETSDIQPGQSSMDGQVPYKRVA